MMETQMRATDPADRGRRRVALIHAVTAAMDPIAEAFETLWPEADRVSVLDESLSGDRAAAGALDDALRRRIGLLADYALACGAEGILYTCSAFGPAIEDVAARMPLPVLKPNEAMFAAALERGSRAGMLATFGPSIASMEAEFKEYAAQRCPKANLRTILVDGAMDALRRGDAQTHNRLVAERAGELADCDVVMLAHFSTSRAHDLVAASLGDKVLTSPASAVLALKALLA